MDKKRILIALCIAAVLIPAFCLVPSGWPIGLVYESSQIESGFDATPETVAPLMSFGPLTIPNTVGRVRGGPNPAEAAEFIEFLLSAEGERLLMGSDSRNVPVRLDLAAELFAEYPQAEIAGPAEPDLEAVAGSIDDAIAIAKDVLGI